MTLRQGVTTAAMFAILLLAWWGMRAGWEHRRRRTEAAAPVLPQVPDDPGPATFGPLESVYVSSTRAGDWLDRVVAHDLGVRSRAEVSVHATGVLVRRAGARDLFLPAQTLRGAGTARGIAGKVVSRDGLVVLTWLPPGADDERGLDTGLLPRHAADRDALVDAVAALIPDTPAATLGTQEKP